THARGAVYRLPTGPFFIIAHCQCKGRALTNFLISATFNVKAGPLHMPIRKTVFVNDHFYHIYNRGVEKRTIFKNKKDYDTFLEILTYYLTPDKKWPPEIFSRKPQVKTSQSVTLLCFCLMPNHFHFLIKQKRKKGISSLMHALLTTYSMYFNYKYERVGSLFQGRFKAKLVDKDDYLLHLSRYIHLNPKEVYKKPLQTYLYSSYRFYLESKPKDFVDPEFILSYFSYQHKQLSYKAFVSETKPDFSPIEPLLLE
ncbi:MAG TPA: transposase, partial [Candidatus Bathyarchaeia archaeon]|nr:transposase [Candidatus Bathyarchaeia archaeon]